MNKEMHQSKDNKWIPMTSLKSGKGWEVRKDVYYYTNQVVNFLFVGDKQSGWVMVDTGMPNSYKEILDAAGERFGKDSKPSAIILTHGHFDHVGNIVALIEKWGVPVYAHLLEFPYLTGEKSYPEPDTSVEGGLLAKLSSMFPIQPVNIKPALNALPEDYTVPGLAGWKWIHTPGHSPGHISLFRQTDRTIIAGDAFITVRQDSFYKVLIQKAEVNGPPRYLTTDWNTAWESVRKLFALNPLAAVTGHGPAMFGRELKKGFNRLVTEFDKVAIPEHGRFVDNPQ